MQLQQLRPSLTRPISCRLSPILGRRLQMMTGKCLPRRTIWAFPRMDGGGAASGANSSMGAKTVMVRVSTIGTSQHAVPGALRRVKKRAGRLALQGSLASSRNAALRT